MKKDFIVTLTTVFIGIICLTLLVTGNFNFIKKAFNESNVAKNESTVDKVTRFIDDEGKSYYIIDLTIDGEFVQATVEDTH